MITDEFLIQKRIKYKQDLEEEIARMKANLTQRIVRPPGIQDHRNPSSALFMEYAEKLKEYHTLPNEIKWDMLSASAFVNSVATTTGYGDIVPVTFNGKICTIIYALYGIPVFIWYVVKLGALFRVIVMRFIKFIIESIRSGSFVAKKHCIK